VRKKLNSVKIVSLPRYTFDSKASYEFGGCNTLYQLNYMYAGIYYAVSHNVFRKVVIINRPSSSCSQLSLSRYRRVTPPSTLHEHRPSSHRTKDITKIDKHCYSHIDQLKKIVPVAFHYNIKPSWGGLNCLTLIPPARITSSA
jgi:hypothetical protein